MSVLKNGKRFLSLFRNFNYNKTSSHLLPRQDNSLLDECIWNVGWCQQKRTYARKLTLTDYDIVWERPESVPDYDPKCSGDLKPFEQPDKTRPTLDLQVLDDEIKKCDEVTQRLLSLEFAQEGEELKLAKNDAMKRVQRHQYDFSSPETTIAAMTTEIRYKQRKYELGKLSAGEKCNLQYLVGKRNKFLRIIRRECYRKFEWLLEQLDISLKPNNVVYDAITRDDSLRKLIDLRFSSIKEKRLQEYKNKLEEEKEPFLEEKVEIMKWIEEVETKYGLPVSVDVYEAEQQLKEQKLKSKN